MPVGVGVELFVQPVVAAANVTDELGRRGGEEYSEDRGIFFK